MKRKSTRYPIDTITKKRKVALDIEREESLWASLSPDVLRATLDFLAKDEELYHRTIVSMVCKSYNVVLRRDGPQKRSDFFEKFDFITHVFETGNVKCFEWLRDDLKANFDSSYFTKLALRSKSGSFLKAFASSFFDVSQIKKIYGVRKAEEELLAFGAEASVSAIKLLWANAEAFFSNVMPQRFGSNKNDGPISIKEAMMEKLFCGALSKGRTDVMTWLVNATQREFPGEKFPRDGVLTGNVVTSNFPARLELCDEVFRWFDQMKKTLTNTFSVLTTNKATIYVSLMLKTSLEGNVREFDRLFNAHKNVLFSDLEDCDSLISSALFRCRLDVISGSICQGTFPKNRTKKEHLASFECVRFLFSKRFVEGWGKKKRETERDECEYKAALYIHFKTCFLVLAERNLFECMRALADYYEIDWSDFDFKTKQDICWRAIDHFNVEAIEWLKTLLGNRFFEEIVFSANFYNFLGADLRGLQIRNDRSDRFTEEDVKHLRTLFDDEKKKGYRSRLNERTHETFKEKDVHETLDWMETIMGSEEMKKEFLSASKSFFEPRYSVIRWAKSRWKDVGKILKESFFDRRHRTLSAQELNCKNMLLKERGEEEVLERRTKDVFENCIKFMAKNEHAFRCVMESLANHVLVLCKNGVTKNFKGSKLDKILKTAVEPGFMEVCDREISGVNDCVKLFYAELKEKGQM
jgi:hypothetical protein